MRTFLKSHKVYAIHRRTSFTWDVFKSIPRQLWLCYLRCTLDSFAFYQFIFTLCMFLRNDHGFDDVDSGRIYALFGLNSVMMSAVSDTIVGYKSRGRVFTTSLYTIIFMARLLLAFSKRLEVLSSIMFIVLPLASAFDMSQMEGAINAHTDETNRLFAFTMYDVADGLGGVLAGLSIDIVRYWFCKGVALDEGSPLRSLTGDDHLTTNEIIFLTSAGTALFVALLSFFSIGHPKRREAGEADALPDVVQVTPFQAIGAYTLSADAVLLSLIIFSVATTRMLQRHLETTFPAFVERNHGLPNKDLQPHHYVTGNVAPWGSLLALQKLLVAVFGPYIRSLCVSLRPSTCLFLGTTIAMLATSILAVSQRYAAIFFFVLFLSLGEMVWSPAVFGTLNKMARSSEVAVNFNLVCTVVSSMLAVLIVGEASGPLLSTYCPPRNATGTGSGVPDPDDLGMMWTIITLSTLAGPLILGSMRLCCAHELHRSYHEEHRRLKDDRVQQDFSDDDVVLSDDSDFTPRVPKGAPPEKVVKTVE